MMANADHNASTHDAPSLQDVLVQLDSELVRVEIHRGGMRSMQETMQLLPPDGDAGKSSAWRDIKDRLDAEVDRVGIHLEKLRSLREPVRHLIDATDPVDTLLPD